MLLTTVTDAAALALPLAPVCVAVKTVPAVCFGMLITAFPVLSATFVKTVPSGRRTEISAPFSPVTVTFVDAVLTPSIAGAPNVVSVTVTCVASLTLSFAVFFAVTLIFVPLACAGIVML
ncbi:hypothetical protein LIBO111022_09345 [Listeria booriae]